MVCSTNVDVTAMDGNATQDARRRTSAYQEKEKMLSHPATAEEHPIMRHTKLMACLLSGKSCENEAYLQRVRTYSWLHGDQGPRNSIDHKSADGQSFAIEGTSIPLIPL
ncbi:hypothetical protein Pcinc_001418 [Petrolisthes cinctipes]|uniref:Uncharacterized protein n=1 Tax=Petrolisthes cinctipes TaxID=88211 RepID=A0AAE1GND1_PETCI|nr:hypothetical protein Pcinc_001418 [Petrolisthes cinctipes]